MRPLALPGVAELAHRPRLAVGHEHRVVPEAAAAARRVGDHALDRAGAAQLGAAGRDRDELAHVSRTTIGLVAELGEELRDRSRAFRCIARRVHPRAAAEGGDLDAGVLADRPTADALVPETGL